MVEWCLCLVKKWATTDGPPDSVVHLLLEQKTHLKRWLHGIWTWESSIISQFIDIGWYWAFHLKMEIPLKTLDFSFISWKPRPTRLDDLGLYTPNSEPPRRHSESSAGNVDHLRLGWYRDALLLGAPLQKFIWEWKLRKSWFNHIEPMMEPMETQHFYHSLACRASLFWGGFHQEMSRCNQQI